MSMISETLHRLYNHNDRMTAATNSCWVKILAIGVMITLAVVVGAVVLLSKACGNRMTKADFRAELTARIAPYWYRLNEVRTVPPNFQQLPVAERIRLAISDMVTSKDPLTHEQRFAMKFTIANEKNKASLLILGVREMVVSVQFECPVPDGQQHSEIAFPEELRQKILNWRGWQRNVRDDQIRELGHHCYSWADDVTSTKCK